MVAEVSGALLRLLASAALSGAVKMRFIAFVKGHNCSNPFDGAIQDADSRMSRVFFDNLEQRSNCIVRAFQHLEKRYFEPGDLGFNVWRTMGGILGMCICNDRRWPEAWRAYGLQGVELMLIGYNSAAYDPNGGSTDHCSRWWREWHNRFGRKSRRYTEGGRRW